MVSRNSWSPLGEITTQQAAIAVTARDAASVDALAPATKIIHDMYHEPNEVLELRVWSDGSENDVNVIEVYASRGKTDHFHRVATITATQGTQVRSGSKLFADTLAVALLDDSFLCASVQNENNQIARVFLDTNGYSRLLFVVPTLATTTVGIEAAAVTGQVHSLLPGKSLMSNSNGGGVEVLSINAASAGNGSDQICRSAMIWTPDTDIYFKIGSDAADANDALLLTSMYLPVPASNTNLLRFFNNGAGAETVNILWRN